MQPVKLAGILGVWSITLLYVLFQGGKTSFMLFIMVSLLIVYLIAASLGGVRRSKGVRSLYAEQEKPDLLYAGGALRVKLQISIPGYLPLPYVVVREMLKRHNGESWVFEESFVPNFKGDGELRFQTPALERGSYTFADTDIITEDIFGLTQHKGSFLAKGQFRILPRSVFIPRWQLYERNSRRAGPQVSRVQSRRETTQINGVRDYVYGDRLTRIHWNATAKTGSWKSKEFEHESIPKTMIVLDGSSRAYSSSSAFELAVSTAASLLGFGIRERIGIGLCCLDKNTKMFSPAETGAERQKMIQYLIDINAEGKGPLVSRLEMGYRMFPRGSYFVLISPQRGIPVLDALLWAESHGMNPSHIHVIDPTEASRADDWMGVLTSRGLTGYSVSSLQELPAVLGGEKR
ncbi:von Willebrand factor A [Paenibacillus wynnii]|uniref:von Willebrand factor A n=1 Tax=Paenibacillus wynnii TaxID=268407 RepID=A0A098M9E5_9BACL|nr:von Willebrand factor A [Paenibacillus wynnii]